MRITKLIAAVVGIGMVLVSLALAVGGVAAITFPDRDGWVSAGPVRLHSDAAALLGDDIEIDFGGDFTNGRTFVSWGEIPAEFDISSKNGKEVFVGITTPAEARAYLDGVAVDRLSSFDDEHDVSHVAGTYQADPPTEADIWVASSNDGLLEWDITSGEWAIVAVNADGSPGIDIGVTSAAKVPFLRPLGAVLVFFALLGTTAGGFLTYYGVRRDRNTTTATTPTSPTESMVTG
jgi:hypothetical protein